MSYINDCKLVLQNGKYPTWYVDGTGSSVPLNILDGTHPLITRPLNNRALWEDGVLEFTQLNLSAAGNLKTPQVYGLLWKLQDKDKQYYMAHVRFLLHECNTFLHVMLPLQVHSSFDLC